LAVSGRNVGTCHEIAGRTRDLESWLRRGAVDRGDTVVTELPREGKARSARLRAVRGGRAAGRGTWGERSQKHVLRRCYRKRLGCRPVVDFVLSGTLPAPVCVNQQPITGSGNRIQRNLDACLETLRGSCREVVRRNVRLLLQEHKAAGLCVAPEFSPCRQS